MNVSATQLLTLLNQHRLRVFTTSDVATLAHISKSAASHALGRLTRKSAIESLKRGVWFYKLGCVIHPYEAIPYLVQPWPSYVSLYTALSEYGIIAEIPQVIYGVTADRPHRYQTSLGSYQLHHLPSHLFWGYEMRRFGEGNAPIAEPEKAFLDLAYLSLTPRSRLKFPPRREKRWNLDRKKLTRYTRRFGYPRLEKFLEANL